jgi:uncharacterized membrane protein YfcA
LGRRVIDSNLAVLVGVGVLAGVVSTVVSLASIVSYPALLALGLPPLTANVTNTVSLMFTGVGAAAGSRRELAGQGGLVLRLGWLTALGGAVGSMLLLATPSRTFEAIAPWLIFAASVLLLVQPWLARMTGHVADPGSRPLRLALFAVAIYTGYFGAAGGIITMAVLTAMLDQTMARISAVKNVVSALANGVAAVGFALFGPVRWAVALPLAAGFLVGGWIGPAIVRRIPGPALRVLAGVCGLAVAAKLAFDAYG